LNPDQSLLFAENLSWQAPGQNFTLEVPHFRLNPGDRYAVVGPSGCGKSSLLGLLSLSLRPDRVEVLDIMGSPTASLWRVPGQGRLTALRARHIGFVPQMSALLPFLNVEANIHLPLDVMNIKNPHHINDLIECLGLVSLRTNRPAALSVGQRQRVAIARALSHQPDIILADEPTASLHPEQATHVMTLLHQQAERHAAVVMVTHDAERAAAAGFTLLPVSMNGSTTQIATA